jgi:hypothetical protein
VRVLASGEWVTRERVLRIALIACGISACSIAWLFATAHGTLDFKGRPLGTDFSNVWTAGHMALDHHAARAWSWPDHFAVQQALHRSPQVDFFGWHYPPPFLLIAALLATLPYVPALVIWQAGTLAPFAAMMWRLSPRRETIALTLGAPVTVICLMHGHNGFLTALLLGAGLMLLDQRPSIAGFLFGALIYKPQFGLIIPPLLFALRSWRAVVSAIASASTLVILTLVIWGWPVWQAFIESLPLTRHIVIEQGATGWYKIMSPFAVARMWGGALSLAYGVQAIFTAASASVVIWAASTKQRPELRNALVCAAALISTPYVLDYDLVILLPALAWLWVDGRERGYLNWEKTLLLAGWFTPLIARTVAQTTALPLGLASIIAALAMALRRMALHARSDFSESALAR